MEQTFLPKEPLDLPKEPLEIPAHALNASSDSVKTLLSWHAPGRPFQKKGKEYYISSLMIAFFLIIILFLFKEFLLSLVVLSFLFVVFMLKTIPPHDFYYRISSEGITIQDHFFLWQELYDFYFKRRDGHDILHIRTKSLIPGEITLTLGTISKEHLKTILIPHLPFREVIKPTFTEKSADWLSKTFPLERTHPL